VIGALQRVARVGLIGTGGIGRAHAEAATTLATCELAAVADIDIAAAESVGVAFGAPALHPDALAEPGAYDLIVVASPPATHLDVVGPLLKAGVPVMCEKPIAVDLASARQLAALAAETGTPLTMATKFRFVDDVAHTRELIATGALGTIVKIEVSFAGAVPMGGRWNSDRAVAGGGVLIDNGTHGVDLVRHLVGDLETVTVLTGPSAQGLAVEDSATLLGRTADGVLAQVDVTWSFRRPSPVYCSVFGTDGSVEIGWSGAKASIVGTEPYTFGSGYSKVASLRDNLAAVLAAFAAGTPPPVTADDAVAVSAVIEAGYAAAAAGSWMSVPLAEVRS